LASRETKGAFTGGVENKGGDATQSPATYPMVEQNQLQRTADGPQVWQRLGSPKSIYHKHQKRTRARFRTGHRKQHISTSGATGKKKKKGLKRPSR